jgi:hypothetical protein
MPAKLSRKASAFRITCSRSWARVGSSSFVDLHFADSYGGSAPYNVAEKKKHRKHFQYLVSYLSKDAAPR